MRRHVGQGVFGMWNKIDVPSTAMSMRSNRLVVLLDSEHRLQILQQLRTTLMSLTIRWPTTWRGQHWLMNSNCIWCDCHAVSRRIKICFDWLIDWLISLLQHFYLLATSFNTYSTALPRLPSGWLSCVAYYTLASHDVVIKTQNYSFRVVT